MAVDAGHLDIHSEFGKIDALGGIAARVSIAALQCHLELVLKISADSLSIGYAEKARFRVLRFSLREYSGFLLQKLDGQ